MTRPAIERRRNVRDELREGSRKFGGLRYLRELRKVASRVGVNSGEREVKRRAEGEQIRPGVERRAVNHLGRDEGRSADDEASLAHRHDGAEVDQLCSSVLRAANVAGAHVAVHETSRMNERQRRADLVGERARLAPGYRRALPEVAAVEQLHRVVSTLGSEPVIVDLDDPRVGELGERVELAFEERRCCLCFTRPLGWREQFQRHFPPFDGIRSAVHHGHSTASEDFVDGVPAADTQRWRRPGFRSGF